MNWLDVGANDSAILYIVYILVMADTYFYESLPSSNVSWLSSQQYDFTAKNKQSRDENRAGRRRAWVVYHLFSYFVWTQRQIGKLQKPI
jgi:hypothetical protein